MSFDGIVTRNIVLELNNFLVGGKINKIYQHEKDEILLHVYNKGKNYKLLISSSSNNPRLHITRYEMENPPSPPIFCMVLRKHLSGGIILNIEQYGMDRIIFIDISALDEFGEVTVKRLIVEIMGKHSNIILVNKESLKIIDAIKRITPNISRVRQILPGLLYTFVKQDRFNPLYSTETDFYQQMEKDNKSKQVYKFFYTNYVGLSPLISKEICSKAGVDIDRPLGTLTESDMKNLYTSFSSIMEKVKDNKFNPQLIKNEFGKDYVAFHSLDIDQFGNKNKIYMNSINQVLDIYYTENDKQDRIYQKGLSIKKSVQNKLERSLKKLAKQKEELMKSEDRDKYKIYGDLISANIYRIEKGVDKIEVENFYDENMEKITIPLDKRYSPAENAQRYYKKYTKLKNAHKQLLEQIPETEKEIEYLENVLNNIDKCTEIIELEEIKEELIEEGYLKGKIKKKSGRNVSKPHHYISSDGFHILVGKNNKQNDYLTLKASNKTDLWLHVQKIPGSHVIIKTENKQVPDKTLEEAAMLAAYYSKGKNSNNVAVDYTERKNIRKPKNAKLGMVIYENYKTIFVSPSEEYIEKIKKVSD